LTPSNSEINLGIGVDTCGDRGGIMRDVRSEHPIKDPVDPLDPLDPLVERCADRIEHPGGTLLDHLGRVATLLEGWGATDDVQKAGLCHACYGTDGFAPSLLGLDERGLLAAKIGRRAEAWVYLYASCDREVVYPALGSPGSLWFRDRFTGECSILGEGDAAVLAELTAANELDIVMVNPAWGAEMGPGLIDLLGAARHRLSASAWEACASTLEGTGPCTSSTSSTP
jgi:hypothetical protein